VALRIRPLPDDVVNRIAAGEVVERPASVLKELLENAVDSGAGRIDAEASGAFPFALRVTDDGCGMTREEAELAVRRHTTSKIATADDLDRIGSFGFRGEALPSIASVARLSLISRPAGQPAAVELVVEGGAVRSAREAGAPPGTTVAVSALFGNVPARRKFLKSERTEMSHLWDVFHGVAIPGEGVAFRFRDPKGESSYESREPAADRARRHAGDDAQYLAPVDLSSAFFRVFGWAGLPQLSRSSASGLWFFVNGRRFRDRGLYAAVREAYRGILPADRLPVVYLFLTCAPAEVDVNVHPGKTEVRFRYSRDLNELVRHAIGQALGEPPARAFPLPARTAQDVPDGPLRGAVGSHARPASEFAAARAPESAGTLPFEVPESVGGRFFSSLRPVGQVLGTYLVCEGDGAMILIDQHAADERIVFSRLKDRYLGRNPPIQQWLRPEEVELPGVLANEGPAVESFLRRTGFSLEPSGEGRIRLAGGPAVLSRFDVRRWWEDLCESVRAQDALPKDLFDADRELWRMACHASVRGGDPVTPDRARRLLAELDDAVAAHSCPHGRPVWLRLDRSRLDAMFHRTG